MVNHVIKKEKPKPLINTACAPSAKLGKKRQLELFHKICPLSALQAKLGKERQLDLFHKICPLIGQHRSMCH